MYSVYCIVNIAIPIGIAVLSRIYYCSSEPTSDNLPYNYVCKIHAVVSYAQFNIYDVPREND